MSIWKFWVACEEGSSAVLLASSPHRRGVWRHHNGCLRHRLSPPQSNNCNLRSNQTNLKFTKSTMYLNRWLDGCVALTPDSLICTGHRLDCAAACLLRAHHWCTGIHILMGRVYWVARAAWLPTFKLWRKYEACTEDQFTLALKIVQSLPWYDLAIFSNYAIVKLYLR
jgi:hypothetical protein